MIVWRICAERHATDVSGRGGILFPARWHTEGHAVIYTSATLALATLETLVHVDKDLLPADRVQVEIDVPDDLAVLSVEDGALPKGWRTRPGPPRLQQIGDEWLESVSGPVLRVPSAVIPTEANYLLESEALRSRARYGRIHRSIHLRRAVAVVATPRWARGTAPHERLRRTTVNRRSFAASVARPGASGRGSMGASPACDARDFVACVSPRSGAGRRKKPRDVRRPEARF